jgi:hypothetical protein
VEECCHDKKHLTLDPDKHGNARFRWHCLSCGEPTSNFVARYKVVAEGYAIERMPLFDNELRERKWKEREARGEEARAYEREKRRAELQDKKADYRAYLTTPEWWEKRELVMKRAGRVCEGCLVNRATEVHHTTYDHIKNELLFELVALCDECHAIAHPEHQHEHS